MTFVVLATEPDDPTAELAYDDRVTVLDRLLGQLAAHNVSDVRIVARPEAASVLRKNGRKVINRRRAKGRKRLAV